MDNLSTALPCGKEVPLGQKEKRKKGKKRSFTLPSEAKVSAKRQKIRTDGSEHDLEEPKCLEKPQADPSSITEDGTEIDANELLMLLGEFLCRRCPHLKRLTPYDPLIWMHAIDLFLFLHKWQDQCFIDPGILVFSYMLCRDVVSAEVASYEELKAMVLACFYVSYTYIGHAISYPARPFIVGSRDAFWKQALEISMGMSDKMLRINIDPQYFSQVLADMKNQADH